MLNSNELNLQDASIQQLRVMLVEGTISCEQLVRFSLNRAEESSNLNAMISLDVEGAIMSARQLDSLHSKGHSAGVLHGIPLVVKDNIHVHNMTNTAGTLALKGFYPEADSPVVSKLKAAGAIILGKANMHELAFGITSNNHAFGTVGNPHAPEKTAGGSSGGTGSAVASGIVPAGLGTDTGGSVRIPSALNGICGHRPSMNRYPQESVTPLSHTRDTIGNLARSVSDLILLDAVICDDTEALPQVLLSDLRLGVPRTYLYDNLDPEVAQSVEKVLKSLKDAGVILVEKDIPKIEKLMAATADIIVMHETVVGLKEYLEKFNTGVTMEQLADKIASPDVKFIFEMITGEGAIDEATYTGALEKKRELMDIYTRYLEENKLDAIVFPTTPVPARPNADITETVVINGVETPVFSAYMRNTEPASIIEAPGISLPINNVCGGMPIGLELDGSYQSDRKLLAIGLAIEKLVKG